MREQVLVSGFPPHDPPDSVGGHDLEGRGFGGEGADGEDGLFHPVIGLG